MKQALVWPAQAPDPAARYENAVVFTLETLVWLNRLKASPMSESFTRSPSRNCRPSRKSTLWKPGAVDELRGSQPARPSLAPAYLTPPLTPPSSGCGAPVMYGVTGWPVDNVTMVENAQPSRISRAA